MDSKNTPNTGKEKTNLIKSQNKFINIKSNFVLKKIFNHLDKNKALKIIRYNTNIKNRLNIDIEDYKSILMDIIPIPNKYGPFINIEEKIKNIFIYI